MRAKGSKSKKEMKSDRGNFSLFEVGHQKFNIQEHSENQDILAGVQKS